MGKSIEEERPYLIPITDTGTKWEQTCKIPVIHTELKTGSIVITYLRFTLIPGKPSGLDILAGGGNLEITGARIRAQMMHRLEVICDALQKPNPPLNSNLEFQQISKYFSPRV